MLVYRGMTADVDGLPTLGSKYGNTLGPRYGTDIPVHVESVRPDEGGMSVSFYVAHLPKHRRPPEFGGTASHPVFAIDSNDLGSMLRLRPDPDDPSGHGFIEPAQEMLFDEYQRAIWATRDNWSRVEK